MKRVFQIFGLMLAALFVLTGIKAEAAPDWNNRVVKATGIGVINPNARTHAQGIAMARRAAITDAQRNLLETLQGVQVTSEVTVRDYITESDIIQTRVEGVLKGAEIIGEREISGGIEITMQVPMFGASSLAEAVMERPAEVVPFPAPTAEVPAPPTSYSGGYTGLVIDCRGLGLNPVMSPVIKNSAGTKIYGHINLDYDLVIRDGMVNYAPDMSGAARAGSNPLVIRAERLEDHNANPVISVNDSNMVLSANETGGFLGRMAVVFLY